MGRPVSEIFSCKVIARHYPWGLMKASSIWHLSDTLSSMSSLLHVCKMNMRQHMTVTSLTVAALIRQ